MTIQPPASFSAFNDIIAVFPLLDPQFGFGQISYLLFEGANLQTNIVITNGVTFQAGVTRRVRINSVDAQVPINIQATGNFLHFTGRA